ncbi:MAG: glycosyltransferase family 1 protein [Rhodospirillales bacterium]|jgi:glycosyltransferase involved in cell wall biosynthesis|nr:glycosyltransferase family 1 protein [Rhodospirillales bacterium]
MATPDPPRHLLHVFPTFAMGGSQARFVALANALAGKYRHTVLAMDGDRAAAAGLDAGIDCRFATMPVVKSSGISPANLRHARELLRRLRPDLLITSNWGAVEWGPANWGLSSCRHIHIEDGFGPDESPERQKRRRVVMRRILLSRAERIIVPSRTLLDVATRVWGFAARRVLHLPNGVDCQRFAAAPESAFFAAHGIAPTMPVIGTVAALRPEKNLARLIRMFATLPRADEARLVIVGDGPQRAALTEQAAGSGVADRILFAGAMTQPERLLGRFDVFALTSDTEQMPTSVLEAMAAGLPIVATDVGDLRDMVAAENAGLIVARDDDPAFAAALLPLLLDSERRKAIGEANRSRVRAHYSLSTMVERYDALFGAAG